MPALVDARWGTAGSPAPRTCRQVGDGGRLRVHKQQVLWWGRPRATASPRAQGVCPCPPCPQGSPCGSAAGCPARLAGCRLPSTAVAVPPRRARRRLGAGWSMGELGPRAPSMGCPGPPAVPAAPCSPSMGSCTTSSTVTVCLVCQVSWGEPAVRMGPAGETEAGDWGPSPLPTPARHCKRP